jgi:hypothetical protein
MGVCTRPFFAVMVDSVLQCLVRQRGEEPAAGSKLLLIRQARLQLNAACCLSSGANLAAHHVSVLTAMDASILLGSGVVVTSLSVVLFLSFRCGMHHGCCAQHCAQQCCCGVAQLRLDAFPLATGPAPLMSSRCVSRSGLGIQM